MISIVCLNLDRPLGLCIPRAHNTTSLPVLNVNAGILAAFWPQLVKTNKENEQYLRECHAPSPASPTIGKVSPSSDVCHCKFIYTDMESRKSCVCAQPRGSRRVAIINSYCLGPGKDECTTIRVRQPIAKVTIEISNIFLFPSLHWKLFSRAKWGVNNWFKCSSCKTKYCLILQTGWVSETKFKP